LKPIQEIGEIEFETSPVKLDSDKVNSNDLSFAVPNIKRELSPVNLDV
jgi:hypothetical protein